MQFEWSTGHDSFPDFLIKLRPPALCQISETPFAELFQASHRMHGFSIDFIESLRVNRIKRDSKIDSIFNPPLFSLVNTINYLPKYSVNGYRYCMILFCHMKNQAKTYLNYAKMQGIDYNRKNIHISILNIYICGTHLYYLYHAIMHEKHCHAKCVS